MEQNPRLDHLDNDTSQDHHRASDSSAGWRPEETTPSDELDAGTGLFTAPEDDHAPFQEPHSGVPSSQPHEYHDHGQQHNQPSEAVTDGLLNPHRTSSRQIPRKPVGGGEGGPRPIAHQATPQRLAKPNIFRSWWFELSSCLLLLTALFAVVATLYPHQNRPLPTWPYHISVNALLSVYTVVLKASLMLVLSEGMSQLKWSWYSQDHALSDLVAFDEASRGPWGCVKLLPVVSLRQPLVSCGALITIVILAIDPFTQQMLRYFDCTASLTSQPATLPRTNFFSPSTSLGEQLDADLLPSVQSAVYAGLFSSGQPVSFGCSTGNCTFPEPYHTVGFCSECEDVWETVDFKAVCNNKTVDLQGSMACSSSQFENYTLTLPSGLSVSGHNSFNDYPTTFAMSTTTGRKVEGILANPNALVLNKRYGCTSLQEKTTWMCRGYTAFSCSLRPCVRTYAATSITAGRLSESLLDSTGDKAWGNTSDVDSDYLGVVDKECLSATERQRLASAGYDLTGLGRWLAYNATFNVSQSVSTDAPFPQSLLAHRCLYLVDNYVLRQIWDSYFYTFFNGSIQEALYNWGGNSNPWQGPQNLEPFYNYGNTNLSRIDDIFRNVSNTLTTWIRETGQTNHSDPVDGRTEHYAICLKVQWAWFALPVALAGLTLLFFAITVLSTSQMEIWKSSPLALLFHGLNLLVDPPESGRERDDRAKANSLPAMSKEAKDMMVRLDWNDGSLGLSEMNRTREDKVDGSK